MPRNQTIKILRTTRANLDAAKTASGLLQGEPYLITDENRLAVGTANNNYIEMPKKGDQTAFRTSHTWTISGAVAVASGDTDYICPFFISVPTGQTAKIVGARYRINSDTSVTVKLTKNGSDISGYTSLSVTTGNSSVSGEITLADNDMIGLIVTAVSGTPKNLSFSLYVEYTI